MLRGLLKNKSVFINNFQKVFDPIFLVYIFFFIAKKEINLNLNFFIILILNFLILNSHKIYTSYRVKNLINLLPDILFISCAITLISILNVEYTLLKNFIIIKFFIFCFIYLSIHHFLIRNILRILRSKGFNTRNAIFIGNKKSYKAFSETLKNNPWLGYKIIYWFTNSQKDISISELTEGNQYCNGGVDNLIKLLKSKNINIDKIFFCNDHSEIFSMNEILSIIGNSCISSSYLINWDASSLSLTKEYYGEIIGLNLWNPEDSLLNYKIKRFSDFFMSLILIILTSPILLITSIAVKFTSKGPIIFKQSRYGLNGQPFIMYKFRTMYSEEKNSKKIIQAQFNDKRITKVGRFIRKYCIDELPQLINVIKGEMSLVGPRPHAVEHNEYYRKIITGYMQRHSKLPGMTGLAQINGARGETSDIELMKKRIKYDIEYNNNWNLGKDFFILIRTFFTVLNGRSF